METETVDAGVDMAILDETTRKGTLRRQEETHWNMQSELWEKQEKSILEGAHHVWRTQVGATPYHVKNTDMATETNGNALIQSKVGETETGESRPRAQLTKSLPFWSLDFLKDNFH